MEEPRKKKSKTSGPPPMASDGLKIGGQDAPPLTTLCKSTRPAVVASRPTAQAEPRTQASPRQATPPSSRPTIRPAQTPSSGLTPAPKAPEPPKRDLGSMPTEGSGSGTKRLRLKLKKGSKYVPVCLPNCSFLDVLGL